MEKIISKNLLSGVMGIALLVLVFQLSQFSGLAQSSSHDLKSSQEIVIKTKDGKVAINQGQVLKELLPDKKILSVTWQELPFKLVEKKIIDLEKLKAYSQRYGQTVTENDLKIFERNYNGNIEITQNNSVFVYNVLWAIGFAAKSPILDYELEKYGWDTVKNLAGYYFSFANLGNGSTFRQSGYNYFDFLPLSAEQKTLVMKIAGKSAVPSCGNVLLLPDCSCSYAVDALILMSASQGFNEGQIYQAMKDVYPYRYPGLYVRHALLFKLGKNQEWSDVNAEELVSFELSSAQGVAQVSRDLATILSNSGGVIQKSIPPPIHEDH